jgi:anti-anti-sigma factor
MNYTIKEDEKATRIAPEGDLDMRVAHELRKILHKAMERHPELLVVDLSQVPFVDSSGIATIVEALKYARKWGGRLEVVSCVPAVKDTFDIAGLSRILGLS